ncbi:MAG: hypothetical protein K0S79_91 [Nitrospira sp.]|jgi:hypothetical protein|nr:hypothetical protein [Nitrospira sp.]
MMMTLLILFLSIFCAIPSYAATTFSAWTADDLENVKPQDAAGAGTSLAIEGPRLSYASGQIIGRCSDSAGSATCTAVDLTLPHLVMTGGPTLTIATTTNATPVQVNFTTAHGLTSQAMLEITGTSIGALDGNVYYVTVVDSDSVTLNGTTAPGSTASAGTAKHAIHKNNIVAYREDPIHIFFPTAPPALTYEGEYPYYLIAGYVGGEKKDPYYMETRTVFPVDVNTVSPVYRQFSPTPVTRHLNNGNNPRQLLTNGPFSRNLTGWTATNTGTGAAPSWTTSGTDGIARINGGAAGTSKLEQCVPQFAGWQYELNFQRVAGTFKVQVGTASGLTDVVAATSFSATGIVRWSGTNALACIQFLSDTSGNADIKKVVLARAITPVWQLGANPTTAGWSDVSSGGSISWASTSGGTLTFTNSGAAIEYAFTIQPNTTYGVYSNSSSIKFRVGTSTGGTQIKTDTSLAAEQLVSFTSGANTGTAYLRILKDTAGAANVTNLYLTTGMSAGRITLSGTYNTTTSKTFQFEITKSGSSATVPAGEFMWSSDGTTWTGPTAMTGAAQALGNGISATLTGSFNVGERAVAYARSARNQPFWIDVYLDSSVPAGVYKGTAAVAASSPATSVNVPMVVTALPLTMDAEIDDYRTYFALGTLYLTSIHTGGSTKKELHKLYGKACLRNHVTCGSNFGNYLTFGWNAGTGALTSASGYSDVNEIGKLLVDGVDTYGSLGVYTTPKGAKWTSLHFPITSWSGTNSPETPSNSISVASTRYDSGTLNVTKYINMWADATNGWKAKVMQCDAACDAVNGHSDWTTNTARNIVYPIDEPVMNVTPGSALTGLTDQFVDLKTNIFDQMTGYSYTMSTTELLPTTDAGDAGVRAVMNLWFPNQEFTTQAYGKPAGTFAATGNYATRADYIAAGVTRIGAYTSCHDHACNIDRGTIGTEDIENIDFRANSTNVGETGKATYDGYSRYAADETLMGQRMMGWQNWHWGRANYELYYATTDTSDNYRGCLSSGSYSSTRGQTSAFNCVPEYENAYMFGGHGIGTMVMPATIARFGGTNDFVTETLTLKAVRSHIQDNFFFNQIYNNALDGGTQLNSIVERTVISSTRYTKDLAGFRSMVSSIHQLAAGQSGKNRSRLTSYPRAVSGQYRK